MAWALILNDGQALTTPKPATTQHRSAARRAHALEKSVLPLPRDTLGLIRSFWQSEKAPNRAVTDEIIGGERVTVNFNCPSGVLSQTQIVAALEGSTLHATNVEFCCVCHGHHCHHACLYGIRDYQVCCVGNTAGHI